MRFTAQPGMCCLNEEGKKYTASFRRKLKSGGVFFNYLAIGLAFLPIL